ncbi:MAG: pantoate--beta-alanine ligase, partial [Calditrichaeota bacterium]
GQKDAQQVVVIRRMIEDLKFNLELKICPIAREDDGLAMSSRNTNLTPAARKQAPVLFQALSTARNQVASGEKRAAEVKKNMQHTIEKADLARIDYLSIADPVTLQELDVIENEALLSLAVYFGEVRLIDNVLFSRSRR